LKIYFINKYPLKIVSIIINVLLLFVPHKIIKSNRILLLPVAIIAISILAI